MTLMTSEIGHILIIKYFLPLTDLKTKIFGVYSNLAYYIMEYIIKLYIC